MRAGARQRMRSGVLLVVGAGIGLALAAGAQQRNLGYSDTPLLPGGKWHVHDGNRPQPRVVDPGPAEAPARPPADAVVLFDGKDLSHWQKPGGGPAQWKVENGYAEVVRGSGAIATKEPLGDCQLHVEWSAPVPAAGSGQGRGNSGILFFDRYEVQVLDSYQNPTYPDGQAGAIYGTHPPLVNAMRKPGEWNSFDIVFTVPRFENDKLVKPGYFTVFHNAVLVQNHVELLGDSLHRLLPRYRPHPPRGALVLQNHSNPVRYRNIWYRELKESDAS